MRHEPPSYTPAEISDPIAEALADRFAGPVCVEGVLTDWSATPKFGRGRITAEDQSNAHIKVVMQMWRLGGGKSHLATGLRVTATGTIEWHQTFGLRLLATTIRPAGLSERQQAVNDFHRSISQRGCSPQRLLEVGRPGRIAIVSPHGGMAALADAREVLKDLPDDVTLLSHRITMGGPAAPTAIAQTLLSVSREADLILIVRGGGSSSDLTVWDDRSVVNRIAACPVPVIVGLGHSTDSSAVALVAHHCAITPTAAALWVLDLYTRTASGRPAPLATPPTPAAPAAQVISQPPPPCAPTTRTTGHRLPRVSARQLVAIVLVLAVLVLVYLTIGL